MVSNSTTWQQETANEFCALEKRARALVFEFVTENMGKDISPDVSLGVIRSAVFSTAALTEFVKTGCGTDHEEGE